MKARLLQILAGLSLIWLAGCPHPRGIRLTPEQGFEQAEQLLQAMAARAGETRSIRAQGVVDMRRKDQRVKAHMLYAGIRPARLRFETHSFFDQPLSIMVLNAGRFCVWDMNKGRFLRGDASPENIARMLPVPLAPEAVVSLLMGDPPLIDFEHAELEWKDREGLYLLKLTNSEQRQEILVHPEGLRTVEAKAYQAGQLLFSLSARDWRGPLPRKVEFEMPGEQMKLKLRIGEIEANPQLPDSLFLLTPPDGLKVEDL